MPIFSKIALFLASLAFAGLTHAAPVDLTDESANFPAAQSMLLQIDQARHTITDTASNLVTTALGFLGVPYKRGGSSAETGFDCSGFVKNVYEQTAGLILPRKASEQAADAQRINQTDLQPGDLVFFNTMRRAFSHVGIYIGEGKFVHSPKPGAEVRVDSMGASYWRRRFDGARRVVTDQK
jgi:cell wall-associated NlpC family hydrolase